MGVAALLTGLTLIVVMGMLLWGKYAAEYVLAGGLCLLIMADVITIEQGLSGFANEGVATIAVLFIVAHGLSTSGVLNQVSQYLLGKPKTVAMAQLRLMLPVALFSSVLNNTPVVAMTIPIVSDWCRRYNLSVSKLMMPLSYAAIIGGVCTLIGTSTNLILNEMLVRQTGQGLALFELAWVGLPCLAAVLAFVLLFSRYLLPDRQGRTAGFGDARQYTVEMIVDAAGPLAGKSVEQADLRNLAGLYLVEIIRAGEVIPVIGPKRQLLGDDRLVFAGNVDAVVELKKRVGLLPAEGQVFKLDSGDRSLVEVVISHDYPLLGKTVKASNFRHFYGAVIIAVHRDGQQVKARFGDLVLKPGDTLLLEANKQFAAKQKFAKDFLVVSPVAEFVPTQARHRWFSLAALGFMLVSVALSWLSMFEAAVVAIVLMLLSGTTTMRQAKKSLNTSVLLVIVMSLGLGVAMQVSGLADYLASMLIAPFAASPWLSLAAIFAITALLSAVVSNAAAAVLMFPIATAVAASLEASLTPFVIVIMVAASASFATPIGYQTNLMVYGPGGYTYSDFLRMGAPLTLLVGLVSVILIPQFWPF